MPSVATVLLLINPNSSSTVTDRVAAEAKRIAPPEIAIRAVTNLAGPEGIQTPDELDAARNWVISTIAENSDCVGAMIGAFGDPGLEQARAVASFPVVGLGEAGLRSAAESGRRFSVVTIGPAMRSALLDKIASLGLREQLASLRFLPHSVIDVIRDRDRILAAATEACQACIGSDGARAVLLGGAPFAGAAHEIARRTVAPVIDGVEAAIRLAIARRPQ
jgi:Asp/Glu/hydantoin racemase